MKILLLQDIKKIGLKGDIKEVADGFARNFLLPRKIAEIATPEVVEKAEKQKKETKKKIELEIENLKKKAKNIEGKKFILIKKTEKGKLFGSVGAKEIAKKIKEEGFEVEESMISLKQQIKSIGEFEAVVNLAKDISAKIKVGVEEK